MILPLTGTMPGMGTVGKGMVLLVTRAADALEARVLSMTMPETKRRRTLWRAGNVIFESAEGRPTPLAHCGFAASLLRRRGDPGEDRRARDPRMPKA